MRRKNKIVVILSSIAVAIGIVAGAGALSARANAETWSVADFAAGYVYGETVDIPDRTVSIGRKLDDRAIYDNLSERKGYARKTRAARRSWQLDGKILRRT